MWTVLLIFFPYASSCIFYIKCNALFMGCMKKKQGKRKENKSTWCSLFICCATKSSSICWRLHCRRRGTPLSSAGCLAASTGEIRKACRHENNCKWVLLFFNFILPQNGSPNEGGKPWPDFKFRLSYVALLGGQLDEGYRDSREQVQDNLKYKISKASVLDELKKY